MDKGAEAWRQYLDGDDGGIARLIAMYWDGLVLFLYRYTEDWHMAEDAAEDTFVRLVTRRPHFSGKSSFKTWLYAIGRNTVCRALGKKRPLSLSEAETQSDDGAGLEEAYIRDERRQTVHRALDRLSPDYRRVLWLTYFEEFSNRETALILKRSVHATEALLSRARSALKNELQKENFQYEDI